jgi:hypothetical protein
MEIRRLDRRIPDFLIAHPLPCSKQEWVGATMSKMGFTLFLVACTLFGWGFAAAMNTPAMAFEHSVGIAD